MDIGREKERERDGKISETNTVIVVMEGNGKADDLHCCLY